MNYLTQQLLNAEEINLIKKDLDDETQNWEDGGKTAGSHASIVKNNLQLKRTSDISKKLSLLIKQKILNNDLIKSFSLPKKIHGIMFTKSSKNMHYQYDDHISFHSMISKILFHEFFLVKRSSLLNYY